MAEYTLTLHSEEDYHLIKKILRAFDGASITPVKKSPLDIALDEAKTGKVVGPFYSVSDLMKDLLN